MGVLHRAAIAVFLAVLFASSVANAGTKDFAQITSLDAGGNDLKIVLMPLDVELSSLKASGLEELNAEWTSTAKTLMLGEMRAHMASRGGELVEYSAGMEAPAPESDEAKIVKLHGAVGRTILYTKVGVNNLPTKKAVFDWTLGPTVAALREKYGADYALFTFVRDSYTSTGRALFMLGAMALFSAYVPGGQQIGFVSLVDLRSGDVAWFNFLSSSSGDIRDKEGATKTVSKLLNNMPK